MKTQTVRITVRTPGYGFVTATSLCDTGTEKERPAIDLNGYDLQPREQPYECKEVWQSRGNYWYTHDKEDLRPYDNYEDFKKHTEDAAYETRIAYKLIDDAVKGEKDFAADIMTTKEFQAKKQKDLGFKEVDVDNDAVNSTPVNEAKEVEERLRAKAVAVYGDNPNSFGGQRDGFVKGYKTAMNDYRATHPIENKDGVKSVESFVLPYTHYDEHYRQSAITLDNAIAAVTDYHAQFTPIEQGKRIEDLKQALRQVRRVEMLTPESEAMINKLLNQ